jgi:hypothetical protein
LDFGCELIARFAGVKQAGAWHGKRKAQENFSWAFEKQMLDLNF